jgi:NADH-ubiquinone oxidoreductase chain 2
MITIAILILIVAKALPVLNTHISSIHVTRITSIVFLFAGALSFNCLNIENIGTGIGLYSGFFQVTAISQLIEIFLFTIGGGILIAWPLQKYNKNKSLITLEKKIMKITANGHSTDYSLIVLFSSLGSSLLLSSYDLISVYLSIELQSFGLYVLSTLYRDSESSTSAGLKYFLLGGLSSCIILLGIGVIYSYTGTTNLESLYIINSVIDCSNSLGVTANQQYVIQGTNLGLTLIFIGFLFKIAAAPLHNWSPDVYDGTPTIVTTWLTIVPKIAILILLLELQVKLSFGLEAIEEISLGLKSIVINNSGYIQNLNQISDRLNLFLTTPILSNINDSYIINIFVYNNVLKSLLLISATLSLIIGSLLGLAQIKIKRLLAYSTISHLGFILLALAVNTEQSIDSFIFYIIQYTITNLNIFLVILGCAYIYYYKNTVIAASPELGIETNNCFAIKDISFIYQFKGLFFNNPLLSLALVISLFSMAGIPPLIGFFSKQLVLYSAIQNGYYFISIVAILVSIISCSYYLQIIKVIFSNEEIKDSSNLNNKLNYNTVEILNEECHSVAAASQQLRGNEIILTNTHSYLISTLTFIILLFFIKPTLILNSTQLLSLSLFYI